MEENKKTEILKTDTDEPKRAKRGGESKTEKSDGAAPKKVKADADKSKRAKRSDGTKEKDNSSGKSKRIFIAFTSIFLGVVMLFGIVLGTVKIIKNTSAVMIYKGVALSEGVANYLAATCKYKFMSGLTASGIDNFDDPVFWQSKADGSDKTYGELLREETEAYIKRIMVGSYLFDSYTSLSAADKKTIKKSIDEVLDYRCSDSKDEFNSQAEEFGFNFKDFKKATELLYKYEMSKAVIFGFEGAALATGNYAAQCAEFLNTYTRVKLLFIRTESQYVTDPETGKQVLEIYDDAKKAEVQQFIDHIDMLIGEEGDESMSEDAFDYYIREQKENDEMNLIGGYYLAATSTHTAELYKVYPSVVEEALTMKMGAYSRVDTDFGVCFLYRCELESGAYSDSTNSQFFGDFYDDASGYLYSSEIEKYFDYVTVKDKFYDIDLIELPYNYNLVANFK